MKSIVMALSAATLAHGSPATAAQQQQAAAPKAVTRAQFAARLDQSFSANDANHDGQLNAAEVQAVQNHELQQAQAQLRTRAEAQFRVLDTNKDGQLSLQEFVSGAVAGLKPNVTPEQLIAKLDTNHDGKISAAEFKAPQLQGFDKIDTNHDGVITPQEAAAAQRR